MQQHPRYGIITHYDVHNHGAVLQLYALTRVLREQFGIEATALRFDKSYDFLGPELKAKYDISVRSLCIYARYMAERGVRQTAFNVRKKRLLDDFKRSHSLVGDFYADSQGLDAVVVGSDEVFALHTGPTPVLFGHGAPADKVFAYAATFGPTTEADVHRRHCEALIASGINAMAGCAVRDDNSRQIVRALTGLDAPLVVDPVLLYGFERETHDTPRPQKQRYMLVYAYDQHMNEPAEVQAIRDEARRRGLQIVTPGFYHRWGDRCVNVDPLQLLQWFRHADCVVTDTFHGSVMSIITHRPLAVRVRDNANKLRFLLEEYGLCSHIIDASLAAALNTPIDYAAIDDELARRRAVSMAYLQQMVSL